MMNFANLDPKTLMNQPLEAWQQLVQEQTKRMEEAYEELQRRNGQAIEQANAAIAELARLAKDSLALTTQMTDEWMKVARTATKQTTDLIQQMTPKANA